MLIIQKKRRWFLNWSEIKGKSERSFNILRCNVDQSLMFWSYWSVHCMILKQINIKFDQICSSSSTQIAHRGRRFEKQKIIHWNLQKIFQHNHESNMGCLKHFIQNLVNDCNKVVKKIQTFLFQSYHENFSKRLT